MSATRELTPAEIANCTEGARSWLVPANTPEQDAESLLEMLFWMRDDSPWMEPLSPEELAEAIADEELRERALAAVKLITAAMERRVERRCRGYQKAWRRREVAIQRRMAGSSAARHRAEEASERSPRARERGGPGRRAVRVVRARVHSPPGSESDDEPGDAGPALVLSGRFDGLQSASARWFAHERRRWGARRVAA